MKSTSTYANADTAVSSYFQLTHTSLRWKQLDAVDVADLPVSVNGDAVCVDV